MDQPSLPASHVRAPALEMFVIYSNPSDFPGKHVVRKWKIVGPEPVPTIDPFSVCDDLREARESLPVGLWRLSRSAADDPVIVESWI